MHFVSADLEDFMRSFYHTAHYDIGSSGVQDYAMSEIRATLGISVAELDSVVFSDSTSYGSTDLREAVAVRWGNGVADHVMVTHGSSEAIYLALNILLNPGDEVITLDPTYHSLSTIAGSIGCICKQWKLEAGRDFQPDLSDLDRLLGNRTKMLIVNFPHNPTGASLSNEEVSELIAKARRFGTYILFDRALAELVYNGEPPLEPTSQYERAISVGTLSKAYGLPGLRFGWCIAPPAVLAGMVHLRDRITLSLSPLTEYIALQVALNGDKLLVPRLAQAKMNLELVRRWASDNGEYVNMTLPTGGVTSFPQLRNISDISGFCSHLAERHHVLLVPGGCFGHSDRVRLGFGAGTATVRRGLEIVARVMSACI
jgi:capreomycidine synthase